MDEDSELTSGQITVIVLSIVLFIFCSLYIIWTVRINLFGCGFKKR